LLLLKKWKRCFLHWVPLWQFLEEKEDPFALTLQALYLTFENSLNISFAPTASDSLILILDNVPLAPSSEES
jgi:hypothetical protein